MKNNKNRMRDQGRSNADLREMKPKENADIGMINGHHIGTNSGKHEKGGKNI